MILVVRSEPERPPSQISAASVRPRRLHGGRLSEDQVSKLSRDIQITHRHMEVTVTTHQHCAGYHFQLLLFIGVQRAAVGAGAGGGAPRGPGDAGGRGGDQPGDAGPGAGAGGPGGRGLVGHGHVTG